MGSIFEYAVGDDEIITANPVKSLGKRMQELLRKNDMEEEINPLTRDELKLLLDAVQFHYSGHYTLFLLLARTGLRAGEALALKWGDIDFISRFIEVKCQFSKGRLKVPKNKKSRRVDMSLQLAETLTNHASMSEYIFTNNAGRLIDLDNWRRRVFNKALLKAGIRKIRVHDLRHTYATIRISEGHDIIDVSNQLGHHTEAFTLKVYNHWIPGKRKSEVDSLDDQITPHPNAPYLHPTASKKENELSENRITH